MAQYRLGTVNVTNGSAVVVGTGTFWTGNLVAGNLFEIAGEGVWYSILAVTDNTHITLSSNYVGTTKTVQPYAVQRDFTPTNNYPIPTYGDIDTSGLLAQTLLRIDAALVALSPVSAILQGDISISGALILNGISGFAMDTLMTIYLDSVSLAVGNTDVFIPISLPAGVTNYAVQNVFLCNANGSLVGGTVGLFTAPAGGGTAIVNGGSAITVSTAAPNTVNNIQNLSVNNPTAISYNATTLYLRVGTAVAGGIVSVNINIRPMP